MEVDYDVYAEGESLLGWLNCTAQLSASEPFDAGEILSAISARIQQRLQSQQAEIAHLKMTLSPDQAIGGAIAAMSLVRNDFVPELSLELEDRCRADSSSLTCVRKPHPSCCAKSSPNLCTRYPARRQSSSIELFGGLPDADPSLHERARVISVFRLAACLQRGYAASFAHAA